MVLQGKLGPAPVFPGTVLGKIGSYFVERYGFREDCEVVTFTGDNPSSVSGKEGFVKFLSLSSFDSAVVKICKMKTLYTGNL